MGAGGGGCIVGWGAEELYNRGEGDCTTRRESSWKGGQGTGAGMGRGSPW